MSIRYWYSEKQKARKVAIALSDPSFRRVNYVRLHGREVEYTECCSSEFNANYKPIVDDAVFLGETPNYAAIRIEFLPGYRQDFCDYYKEDRMKCPVCKFLNVKEEARKHLNQQTMNNILFAAPVIRNLEKAVEGVVLSKCPIHLDNKILARDLRHIAEFVLALREALDLNPGGIRMMTMQFILNRFPRPQTTE